MELNDYLALQNKRRKPHAQPEAAIQMQIVSWLRSRWPDVLFTSTQGGTRVTIGQAVKLKRLGYHPGIPDLLIFEPRGETHGLFIELKAPSGKASEEQLNVITILALKGYRAIICRGLEEAVRAIDNYLKIGGG